MSTTGDGMLYHSRVASDDCSIWTGLGGLNKHASGGQNQAAVFVLLGYASLPFGGSESGVKAESLHGV
jgi:hypothetical protein